MGQSAAGEQTMYDVIIVGGGPAGLSAATILGRARRRVVVFDDGNSGHSYECEIVCARVRLPRPLASKEMEIEMVVPAPGLEFTENAPFNSSTRERIFCNPFRFPFFVMSG